MLDAKDFLPQPWPEQFQEKREAVFRPELRQKQELEQFAVSRTANCSSTGCRSGQGFGTIFAGSRLTFYAIGCVLVNVYGKTFTVMP
ncbi:hypothetical protein ACVDG5_012660 [Mesorhizobium sp. ORM6]